MPEEPISPDFLQPKLEVSATAPVHKQVAFTVIVQSWATPIVAILMLVIGFFGGFYSHADKALLMEFQRVDWRARQEIVAALSDARLRQLGRRLVAFYAPELLLPVERTQYNTWLRERWATPDAPKTTWMTYGKAQLALEEVQSAAQIDPAIIDEISTYLHRFA